MIANSETLRLVTIGNCCVYPTSQALRAFLPNSVVDVCDINEMSTPTDAMLQRLAEADVIFRQPSITPALEVALASSRATIVKMPRVVFQAYFPDCVYANDRQRRSLIHGPIGPYSSAIVLHAWRNSWTTEQTIHSFNERVFSSLGYFDWIDASRHLLVNEGVSSSFPIADYMENWIQNYFMYTTNHSRLFVSVDIVRHLLDRLGVKRLETPATHSLSFDGLWYGYHWAHYPPIADHLGLKGKYSFKKAQDFRKWESPEFIGLEQFVKQSFKALESVDRGAIDCSLLDEPAFLELEPGGRNLFAKAPPPRTPYTHLPDRHFWRKSVAEIPPQKVDPVGTPAFRFSKTTRIATAGSCFAQHIARNLQKRGYNYCVFEQGPEGISPEDAEKRNFGIFSARYGNIYTARQLKQLVDRAFNHYIPDNCIWSREDGRFVDAFRPQAEPEGFATVEDVLRDRDQHLAAVRTMIHSAEVFVFTLGLTEGWMDICNGAVFPLAPGVSGGTYDPSQHMFVNFSLQEIVEDLTHAFSAMLRHNNKLKILVSVSPVPLIATYEQTHVLNATTCSKSILRTAAEEICNRFQDASYFPSYEIITGSFNRGRYFAADLRSVTEEGVDHVMGLVFQHYTTENTATQIASPPSPYNVSTAGRINYQEEGRRLINVVCDEEALDPS